MQQTYGIVSLIQKLLDTIHEKSLFFKNSKMGISCSS